MKKQRLDDLCLQGERADELLMRGLPREALKKFQEIVTTLEKTGDLDSYLAARVTLSVLRCHLKLADFKSAFGVWNAEIEDSVYGVGIYALESAQTTVKDMIAYDMLCAFLHTLADHDKGEAGSAVNQYLSRVCEHATENGDRLTMKLALNNWKQHLRDVFGGTIPMEIAKPLIAFEKSYGEPVKPMPIEFPMPSAWEKPADFREMSRVAELKERDGLVKDAIKSRKSRAG
jgi:hypothetical protein